MIKLNLSDNPQNYPVGEMVSFFTKRSAKLRFSTHYYKSAPDLLDFKTLIINDLIEDS